jgi:hypothetical protein
MLNAEASLVGGTGMCVQLFPTLYTWVYADELEDFCFILRGEERISRAAKRHKVMLMLGGVWLYVIAPCPQGRSYQGGRLDTMRYRWALTARSKPRLLAGCKAMLGRTLIEDYQTCFYYTCSDTEYIQYAYAGCRRSAGSAKKRSGEECARGEARTGRYSPAAVNSPRSCGKPAGAVAVGF